jgi:predicted ABC-type ATPase
MTSEMDVVVIGGPNGAGKTTWAYRRLSSTLEIREFVNADEIARGLSPLNPDASAIAAGRLMLNRLNELVDSGVNFAFETTCSGRGHSVFLKRCRTKGYRITLIFLWLPSSDVAVERVARRVSRGGHRIRLMLLCGAIQLASEICATSICRLPTSRLFMTIRTVKAY